MWTRALIKSRAKDALRVNYWKAFLVSLVIAIAGGSGSSGGNGRNVNRVYDNLIYVNLFLLIILSVLVVGFFLRILIGYMLEVGGRKYFIEAASGRDFKGFIGYCFQGRRYIDVLATMLLRSVYTFLWTLLLIIPGIIKSYAYRMVPYILADNPSIGYNRAIQLSNEMTRGNKFDMFVLDLSFIGWRLLGLLACGIGIIFVQPYVDMTEAELYLIFRKEAIDRGFTSMDELNLKNEEDSYTYE